jgi:hypothetical protein
VATIPKPCPGCRGLFQNTVFPFSRCLLLLYHMATKLIGEIVVKLFGPNYAIDINVRS